MVTGYEKMRWVDDGKCTEVFTWVRTAHNRKNRRKINEDYTFKDELFLINKSKNLNKTPSKIFENNFITETTFYVKTYIEQLL